MIHSSYNRKAAQRSLIGGGVCCYAIDYLLSFLYLLSTISIIVSVLLYTGSISYARNAFGTEGICNICKAQWNAGSDIGNVTTPSTYDYVYFGHLDGTKQYNLSGSPVPVSTDIAGNSPLTNYVKTGPLKFRVLNTIANGSKTGTGESGTAKSVGTLEPALFLLTEYPIGYRKFHGAGQTWYISEINSFLNGASVGSVYNDCFDVVEQSVIMQTYKQDVKAPNMQEGVNELDKCDLIGERIFLLSAHEASTNLYGFSDSSGKDINKKVVEDHTGGMYSGWWLRSACSNGNNSVARVNSSGYSSSDNSYNSNAVRFALNIPLSRVLLTSDASDEEAGFAQLELVADRVISNSDEFKLTILDNRSDSPRASFAATSVSPTPASGTNSFANPIFMSHGGEILTIGYKGATTGDNEYISAIIRRAGSDYETFEGGNYYGVLKKSTSATDTVKLNIPEGIPKGKYTVMILNEQKNGAYSTNYANKFDIHIQIDNTQLDQTKPIVIGKVYTNENHTGFRLEAKDSGILKEIQYTINNTPKCVPMHGQVCWKSFTTSSAINEFKIYNQKGLYSTVANTLWTKDSIAPTVRKEETTVYIEDENEITVGANETKMESYKWKLTMQDNESGLWKITDTTGDIVIKDYSDDGYPITQEEFVVPWEYDQVRVYDGVGNYTTVDTDAHEVGTLGYSCIRNPVNGGGKWDEVYFGFGSSNSSYFDNSTSTNGTSYTSNSQGILCRVLNTTANDNAHTPALFLLSEFVARTNKQWDSRGVSSNMWVSRNNIYTTDITDTSETIKSYMDKMLKGCFIALEKNVIMKTKKTESGDVEWYYNGANNNPRSCYAGATDLNGEQMFLLSAQEITDRGYGFLDKKTSSVAISSSNSGYVYSDDVGSNYRMAKSGSVHSVWWLRSAYSYSSNNVACVNSSGYSISAYSYNTSIAVRFALNIPLSSVLITSHADASNPSNTTFSPMPWSKSTTSSPKSYKLTIADRSTSSPFKIQENSARVAKGGKVILHYENKTGTIRALIKNSTGSFVACGYLGKDTNYEDIVSFDMPTSGISAGTYKMIVYDEVDRGVYKTHTAKYDTLKLTVVESGIDQTAPNVLNTYKNQDGTYYKVIAEDPGGGLSHIISGSAVKDISELAQSGSTNVEVTAGSAMDIYDLAWNKTSVASTGITNIDKTPPDYKILYNQGDYTIYVSDTESGMWKLTDSTGNKIFKDWSR